MYQVARLELPEDIDDDGRTSVHFLHWFAPSTLAAGYRKIIDEDGEEDQEIDFAIWQGEGGGGDGGVGIDLSDPAARVARAALFFFILARAALFFFSGGGYVCPAAPCGGAMCVSTVDGRCVTRRVVSSSPTIRRMRCPTRSTTTSFRSRRRRAACTTASTRHTLPSGARSSSAAPSRRTSRSSTSTTTRAIGPSTKVRARRTPTVG